MAKLVKCKSCGGDVAVSARACPKCGAAPKKSMGIGGWFLAILIAVGIVAYLKTRKPSSSDDDATTDGEVAAAIEVKASDLEKAYASNEIAADDKYKGKALRVSGVVDTVQKDILDNPQVILKSRGFTGVICTFDEGQASSLASLKKGAKVALRGKGAGVLIGSPVLDDCQLD